MLNFVADAGVVAVIIGLVSAAKTAGLPGQWSPLFSIILGVVVDVAFKSVLLGSVSLGFAILTGLVSGLSASGLYSGVKATFSPSSTPSA